jgi:hypothetical protein
MVESTNTNQPEDNSVPQTK